MSIKWQMHSLGRYLAFSNFLGSLEECCSPFGKVFGFGPLIFCTRTLASSTMNPVLVILGENRFGIACGIPLQYSVPVLVTRFWLKIVGLSIFYCGTQYMKPVVLN